MKWFEVDWSTFLYISVFMHFPLCVPPSPGLAIHKFRVWSGLKWIEVVWSGLKYIYVHQCFYAFSPLCPTKFRTCNAQIQSMKWIEVEWSGLKWIEVHFCTSVCMLVLCGTVGHNCVLACLHWSVLKWIEVESNCVEVDWSTLLCAEKIRGFLRFLVFWSGKKYIFVQKCSSLYFVVLLGTFMYIYVCIEVHWSGLKWVEVDWSG